MDSADAAVQGYWAIGSGIPEQIVKSFKCSGNAGEGAMLWKQSTEGIVLVQPCSQSFWEVKGTGVLPSVVQWSAQSLPEHTNGSTYFLQKYVI